MSSATCRLQRGDEEFAEAARQHSKVVLRRPILWMGRVVVLMFLALLTFSMFTKGFHPGPFVLGLVVAYLFFFLGPTIRWLSRRELRAAPHYGVETQVFIGPSGIDVATPNIALARMAWPAFSRAVRTSSGFLVYVYGGAFIWLPFLGFSSGAEVETVDGLLRENIQRYEPVA